MSFTEVANSSLLYICVSIGILYVLSLTIVYLRKTWKRAVEIGISKDELKSVVKASLSFSFVPSLGIVVGLFSLVAMLGIPWPWFRLSVIGSVTYEIMAADTALSSIGSALSTATGQDFTLIMFVMSIGILGGLIGTIFFTKKIQMGTIKLKQKDPHWGVVAVSIFMTALLVVFIVPMILGFGVEILTALTSAGIALLISLIVKVTGAKWLNNFILAIALIGAMASSVLWVNLLG